MTKTAQDFSLPDFRNLGILLRLILAAQALGLGAALLAVLSDMPPVGLRGHVLPGAGRLGLPEDGHTTGSRMEWEYSVVIDRVSLGAMGWAKTLGTDSAAPNLGRAAGRGG